MFETIIADHQVEYPALMTTPSLSKNGYINNRSSGYCRRSLSNSLCTQHLGWRVPGLVLTQGGAV